MSTDFEKQRLADFLAWQWFPRGIGFWIWFTSTVYTWKIQDVYLDRAATIGLGIGIATWAIAKLATWILGSEIIDINLWQYGCGCVVRTIAIEIFQYLAIALICISAAISQELTLSGAALFFVIGSINWLLFSIKNV